MNTVTDDLIRAFLADEARRALAAAPSLDQAVGRLAPRIEGQPSGASQRLIILLAATLLLVAALGTAIAVGSGILRLSPDEPSVDLGIFEPVAGWIVYGNDGGIWGDDPSAPTSVQLTPEAGTPLAWSSDGTRLLITRGSCGEEHLFVLHADGSETRVTDRPMRASGPTLATGCPERAAIGDAKFSADGSLVVFAAESPDGEWAVYSVDADGGPATVLASQIDPWPAALTFSPDGTQIAYVLWGHGDGEHPVWVMDADGTDAHEILANDIVMGAGHVRDRDGALAWSPAGDRIALALEGTVYTFATDGSDFKRVTFGNSPLWSPDGSQLVARSSATWHPGADVANVSPTPQATDVRTDALQPALAELVLQFQSWWTGGEGPARTAVAVYADGRVIWDADGEGDYLELRLTPEGIERLRSRVVSTGSFDGDVALGLDLDIGNLEVFRGDQSVNLAWGRTRADLFWTNLQDRFVEATPAQAGELTELVAFFSDPAAWALPPEMYRQSEITPFVPTHLVVGFDRAAPDWSTLPSPAREVVTRHLEPALRDECDISIDQAREVLDALVQAEVIAAVDDVRLGFSFDLGPSFVHLHQALPPVADCP